MIAEEVITNNESFNFQTIQARNQTVRKRLLEQKTQIILKLHQQKHQMITVKKNRYTCSFQQLQKGLEMFVQASINLLDVYITILIDDTYLGLLSNVQIDSKLNQIKSSIEKNWNAISKHLVKSPQELQTIKNRQKNGGKKKGKNAKIPSDAACVMQKWLLQNFSDPYPSHSKKLEMAKQSNLSVYQVNNWFINARERVVKKFYRKEKQPSKQNRGEQEQDNQQLD